MPIYVWYPVLGGLGLGFAFMSLPPVNDQLMALFGVSYGGLSVLLSALLWSHALGQVPAGLLIDRLGFFKGLLLAVFLYMAACLIPFIKPDSLILAISMRFLLGAGTSLLFLSLVKVVGVLAPPGTMARCQGFLGAAFCVGTVIPYLILPRLGQEAWRWSYLLTALLALLILLGAFKLPSGRGLPPPEGRGRVKAMWRSVKAISTSGTIWMLGLFHGLSYGSLNNLGQWLPSILADLDGRGRIAAWTAAAGLVLLAGAFGRACAGEILRFRTKPQVANGSLALIAVLYLFMGLSGNPYLTLAGGLLLALTCGGVYASIFSLTAAASGPAYLATAIGFMNMAANLFNVLLILMFGYLKAVTGHFSSSLLAAGIMAALAWSAGRRLMFAADKPPLQPDRGGL